VIGILGEVGAGSPVADHPVEADPRAAPLARGAAPVRKDHQVPLARPAPLAARGTQALPGILARRVMLGLLALPGRRARKATLDPQGRQAPQVRMEHQARKALPGPQGRQE